MILANKRPSSIGQWQQEQQCGDCGSGVLVGEPVTRMPDGAFPRTGPQCEAYYKGRPANRCGWPTTIVWLFRRREP